MRKSRWLWIAILVAAAVGGGAWWRARRLRAENEVHYDTALVDQGRITAKVTATGTLSAIVTVQVGSQVSGTIAALYADFNSAVRKGQRIAKIDPRLFEAAAQQARANLVAAQGNLAEREDALRVANAALRFLPPPSLLAQLFPNGKAGRGGRFGGRRGPGERNSSPDRRTVWVLRDGKPKPVRIKIGISDGSLTEVAEGDLKAGDVALTGVTLGEDAASSAPAAGGRGPGGQPGNFPRRIF